jgi:hypothetical protein
MYFYLETVVMALLETAGYYYYYHYCELQGYGTAVQWFLH